MESERGREKHGVIPARPPIGRGHAGAVVGSISVSSPVFRDASAYIDQIKIHLIAAADLLSTELGAPGAILRGSPKSVAAE